MNTNENSEEVYKKFQKDLFLFDIDRTLTPARNVIYKINNFLLLKLGD